MSHSGFILTLSCPDQPGIVHAVSGLLFEQGCNILDSDQYGDEFTNRFFMRVHFVPQGQPLDLQTLRDRFAPIGDRFSMQWGMFDAAIKPRVMILVSKIGHCLNDLLFRARAGQLPIEIAAIASNHRDFYQLAASYDVPFMHLPLLQATDAQKAQQEARIWEIAQEQQIDLVVLARYMQILSDDLCRKLEGRAINIHHSFLPSFKGAKPYHQAYARGVKTVGATAHYVNAELDEGPIISQQTVEVDHTYGPEDLVAAGRDTECKALSNAVRWHCEGRVILHGNRTVVLR